MFTTIKLVLFFQGGIFFVYLFHILMGCHVRFKEKVVPEVPGDTISLVFLHPQMYNYFGVISIVFGWYTPPLTGDIYFNHLTLCWSSSVVVSYHPGRIYLP